ncbi:hypothetical protein JCM11641_000618 [Rhodosporidiobolus odoratus]
MAGVAHTQDNLRDYLSTIPEYSTPRIQFYYSSLAPKKQSNPAGYSSAINWWRHTLVSLVQKGLLSDDKLVLTVDEDLREKLKWDKVGRPTSLGVIVAELAQTSDLTPLSTYLASPLPSADEPSWSVASLLTRPFWWGLSKVWGDGGDGPDLGEKADDNEWKRRKGEWVVPELVEKAATALLPRLPDLHADALSRLYTLRSFREKLGPLCLPGVTLSLRDCEVLARYLEVKGECAFDGEVIKFSAPLSTPATSTLEITQSDRSTLSLLSTLSSLSNYITSLETRISSEQALVRKYAAGESKNLTLAKGHMVGRKRLEKLLDERVGARSKVQEVVLAIERAAGDEETLQALSLGTSTLREVLSSPTLQLSNIEATTSALDDALITSQQVTEAVDSAATPLSSEMEGEVEEELKELVEEEKMEKREKVERTEEERVSEMERKMEQMGKVPEAGKVEDKEQEKVVDKADQLLASFPGLEGLYGWVTVDGQPAEVYGVEEKGGTTVAYIEAKDGTTIWPFHFAKLQTTDDDENACKDEQVVKNIGTVQLRYWRVKNVRTVKTSVKAAVQAKPVHERSKKAALSHQAGYGAPVAVEPSSRSIYDWVDSLFSVLELRYLSRSSPSLSPETARSPSPERATPGSPAAGPSQPRRSSSTQAARSPSATANLSRASQLKEELESLERLERIAKLKRELALLEGGAEASSTPTPERGARRAAVAALTAEEIKKVKLEEGAKLEREKKRNKRKGISSEVIDLCDSDSD